MVDNEKQENLANARRKLKKFRDQQQPNTTETNGNNVHSINGTSIESTINYNTMPQTVTSFVNEQQAILNGIHQNLSKSPVVDLEEQNRQYGLLIENQKQERTRLENQRQLSGGSNMSGRSSQISLDTEHKLRRDAEHLQEQLEIHVQTIGILVAEKTDISAKLTQSFKQLERKQSEMDELHGRLKASRERVQELEKQMQNSTSNVQKREMAAKESDKENDRLKIENIRQSQLIEDLKQNINELNEKLHNRQNNIDQLNTDLEQLKKQPQSSNETSMTEQQIHELQQTIELKNNQIEEFQFMFDELYNQQKRFIELHSSINRMRSDNDQYQQYNANMQHHIQELNNQLNELTQTNHILQNKHDEMRKTYELKLFDQSSILEHDNLQQENQLFRNAIDQWSNRYEELRLKLEQLTKLLTEKDEHIAELTTNLNNSIDRKQFIEVQQEFDSNEKQIHEQQTQTEDQQIDLSLTSDTNDDNESQQQLIERFNRAMHENADLKDRTQHLEHVILQLQSETETIGDYIYLYQQQREQLQRRYQEKDDYITQLTQDRFYLHKKLSELEILLIHGLNRPITNINQSELNTNGNGQSETMPLNTNSIALRQLSDETKDRILILIKELGQNNLSTSQNDNLSTIKKAFVDKNLYICSTCSGPVQWV